MKKLLSVLAAVGVVASSSVSVVACGTKKENKPEESKKNIIQIVQDFEQDVTRIWTEHYEKEVAGNLIGVESMEEGNEFLNKYNIQKFSKPENKDKLTSQNKQQLTNDVEKLFKVELLKEKLNELKKLNKYKVILDEVDSVFEHVELLFNDKFEINSGELVAGSYIGNIIVDYKIVTHYKGVNDVEKFKQSGTLKYTSTESESFKKVGDAMYKNIAKDMFISQETQNYVNLKWSEIKQNKQDYEAYVNSNSKLKEYYNKNKQFQDVLLKTINDKYFKQQFPSMEIKYAKPSIYKTDNFLEENKQYLFINNFDDQSAIEIKQSYYREKISKILLGDEEVIKETLKSEVFNLLTLEKNKKKYRVAQNNLLNGFLSKVEVGEYQKTKYYDFAIAMGYIEFVGPSIKIGAGESTYDHQLPDFKLVISYSMNGITDDNSKSLVDLSLKLFDVYKKVYIPKKPVNDEIKFLLNFYYNHNLENIWNPKYVTLISMNGNDINLNLKDFSPFYFKKMDKSLNLLNMTKKVFINSNIEYSINVKDYNRKLSSISLYASDKNVNSDWSFYINVVENKGYYNFFEELNYLQFNLFGIVKMNIYFNKTLEKGIIF